MTRTEAIDKLTAYGRDYAAHKEVTDAAAVLSHYSNEERKLKSAIFEAIMDDDPGDVIHYATKWKELKANL